ncbi:HET domain-containing protein [Fusarium sp. LHS14.1]|nr:HET domain-containing protein [Fusarium sp. LHS14.1]
MYLLHCSWDESFTDLSISLESCTGSIPKYAILSHRWATNPQDEVTFEDMTMRIEIAREKSGFEKIRGCCAQALRDGLHWVWIDTCCIDKRNSAELSEAINSMYSWYEKSEICYAYLEDVYIPAEDEEEFRKSSWFTRGWTLQELIAPAEVQFFTTNWVKIGNKSGLASTLAEITGVTELALVNGVHAYKASIAEKMSWGAYRKTTRVEDRAYSLMGIFGVTMPTLYGEGHYAFARLQQEIMRISHDHSIFAWQRKSLTAGLLAESPDEFAQSSACRPADYQTFIETFNISKAKPDFVVTNFGLHIQLPLAPIPEFDGYYVAYLACTASDQRAKHTWDTVVGFTHPEWKYEDDEWIAIFLHRQPRGFLEQFTRTSF